MSDSRRKELLSKAVTPPSFTVVGTLTAPRTYGVYQLNGQAKSGRTFRFGNHPVRQTELTNQYGRTDVVAVFFIRRDAVELANIEQIKRVRLSYPAFSGRFRLAPRYSCSTCSGVR